MPADVSPTAHMSRDICRDRNALEYGATRYRADCRRLLLVDPSLLSLVSDNNFVFTLCGTRRHARLAATYEHTNRNRYAMQHRVCSRAVMQKRRNSGVIILRWSLSASLLRLISARNPAEPTTSCTALRPEPEPVSAPNVRAINKRLQAAIRSIQSDHIEAL
ncbi:hypothetical protein GGI14_003630 [Coemansia sp. S680]|nr:hypothetical protein GGI14_003630 [Coemansia sp. S680]